MDQNQRTTDICEAAKKGAEEGVKTSVNGQIEGLRIEMQEGFKGIQKKLSDQDAILKILQPVTDGVGFANKAKGWTIWWAGWFAAISVVVGGLWWIVKTLVVLAIK